MKMIKRIILISLCLLIVDNIVFAQAAEDPKYKINPTADANSSTKVYIPKDLEDCFKELEKMLSPELVKEMKSGTEDDMMKHHFGLGRWMRNNWGLWSDPRLKKYFNGLGIYHPDDMSGIILTSFWRHLNNKPIQLDEQIKYYKDYWEKNKSPAG